MTSRTVAGHTNVGVQILRGLAASAVVIHHTMEETRVLPAAMAWPDWAVRAGAAGVDVFFVISGFVMYLSVFERRTRPTPGAFLLGRAQRIYPLYWFCLFAVVALWATGLAFRSSPVHGTTIFKDLLLIPHEAYVITVAWTLVYEMYFYMTLALVLALPLNRSWSIAAVLAILAGWFSLSSTFPDDEIGQFLANPVAFEFCYGLVLGHLTSVTSGRLRWPAVVAILGVLGSIVASGVAPATNTGELSESYRYIAWGLPALLIVAGFSTLDFGRLLGHGALIQLGNASYSVYLTHLFVMIGYARALKAGVVDLPAWLAVAIVTTVALVVGFMAHLFVEKPLIAVAKRSVAALRRKRLAQGGY